MTMECGKLDGLLSTLVVDSGKGDGKKVVSKEAVIQIQNGIIADFNCVRADVASAGRGYVVRVIDKGEYGQNTVYGSDPLGLTCYPERIKTSDDAAALSKLATEAWKKVKALEGSAKDRGAKKTLWQVEKNLSEARASFDEAYTHLKGAEISHSPCSVLRADPAAGAQPPPPEKKRP